MSISLLNETWELLRKDDENAVILFNLDSVPTSNWTEIFNKKRSLIPFYSVKKTSDITALVPLYELEYLDVINILNSRIELANRDIESDLLKFNIILNSLTEIVNGIRVNKALGYVAVYDSLYFHNKIDPEITLEDMQFNRNNYEDYVNRKINLL